MGLWALNAILTLIGGAGAGYVATQEQAPSVYEAAPLGETWESRLPYRVTASFYKESPVKVGNFPDAKVEEEGLGIHSVYVPALDEASVAKAYSSLSGYAKVGVQKVIRSEKRPGFQDETPTEGEEEE